MYILTNPEKRILEEIKNKKIYQSSIIKTYALALIAHDQGEKVDFSAINQAIVSRWSISGLEHVKRQAHKIAYPNK
jgi:hypothetical protein